jgi:AraC-like DNA-binding protein/ribosomal protein S18 acetylase RimI-like enzyme
VEKADTEKSIEYISRNLTEHLKLDDIARFCGYSAYHFSREFARLTGIGVFDCITKLRIERAKTLLPHSKSVLSVALDSGYETHNAFTTAFQKWIGCNPAVYKAHENKSYSYERQEHNMENTIIRIWRTEDVDDIWENVFSRNTPEEIKDRIRSDLKKRDEKIGFHVVAEVDGIVVGTLGCQRISSYSRNAELTDFIIHPDYQGKGLARQLLDGLISEIKLNLSVNNPVSMLMISTGAEPENQETINKYNSLGFTEAITAGGLCYLVMVI